MTEEKQNLPIQAAVNQPVQAMPARWNSTSEEEMEIDLGEVLYLLWGNITKIIVCMIAGAALAFTYTYFLVTPMYTATSKMYILSSSSSSVVNLSDLQISNTLRADYRELLKSRPLLEEVITDLNLPYTVNRLSGMVTITNPTDTRILNVTVTTPSAQQSADIANAIAKKSQEHLPRIMKTDEPSVFENAVVPTAKSSPSYSRNTIIGALLGVILCCGVIIIRYLANDTMITPDDVYRTLGIEPLATIPEGDLTGSSRSSSKKSKSRRKRSDKKKKEG
jgi:capsular polysaccharide biosynthesis protein